MVFCNMEVKIIGFKEVSHNPYFNRWFSAMLIVEVLALISHRHNPYFNRWFSAIWGGRGFLFRNVVTILILIDGFLQCII